MRAITKSNGGEGTAPLLSLRLPYILNEYICFLLVPSDEMGELQHAEKTCIRQ